MLGGSSPSDLRHAELIDVLEKLGVVWGPPQEREEFRVYRSADRTTWTADPEGQFAGPAGFVWTFVARATFPTLFERPATFSFHPAEIVEFGSGGDWIDTRVDGNRVILADIAYNRSTGRYYCVDLTDSMSVNPTVYTRDHGDDEAAEEDDLVSFLREFRRRVA